MSENRDSISQKPRWPVSRIIKVVCLALLLVVLGALIVFFGLAVWGYDPRRGIIHRRGA